MNEENTTIMPPEKQIVQDDRDARAEELESAFSYDGYQVVRKELFAHVSMGILTGKIAPEAGKD